MRKLRSALLALATVVTAFVALPMVPAAASTEATPASSTATQTFTASTGTGSLVADVITCTAQANYPHNSSHVPGTVNAVITTSCTKPVTQIEGIMSLYRNNVFVASGDNTTAGSASMNMNAATPCVNGSYHSEGGVSVTFPPGYTPPFADLWPVSATVSITCNGAVKVYVDTFANAAGSSTPGGPQTGTLYAGTNYVFCKVGGPVVQHGSDWNHWWLLTDLDTGNPWRNQYVSAYYLSRWGNDVAKDNNGVVIRDC